MRLIGRRFLWVEKMAISAREVMQTKNRVLPLPLPFPFNKFLGVVPQNSAWKCVVYGAPGSGKSTFLLNLADVLTRYGGVLYGNLEESVSRGTLQQKLKLVNVASKVMFLEKSDPDELYRELDTGAYKYCVVDSISEFAKSPKQYKLFKDKINEYKDVTFFFVLHATKSALNYKGPSELSHDADLTIGISHFNACPDKNRFQNGDKNYVFNILKRTIHEKVNDEKRKFNGFQSKKDESLKIKQNPTRVGYGRNGGGR